MTTDIGPKIGLDGEKEFRAALQSMGQQLKTLDTEMRAVTSAFGANDKSQKALSAQSDVLTQKLSTQEARLAEIQKALDYARANYAENSNEVQRWQQAMNNATADVNKTKREIENLGTETEDTGEKVSIFGDVLKANLASEAIISGVKALAGAIKSLIGGAVESYGDFEQLVGGVETLFKDSAGVVQGYAQNAYKTAGLSANDYMETVTSFSASLLQSMGNDTAKAAEKADLAITDMSDNANKMGTDMTSIQNAYQGFAKSNYTMLDNLKLGYGGTKEEMQRLIDDANALNAAQGNYTNYTINSYADIVDAIHTVQTEMGITGTTAKEAATTIQGSAAAAKAAWKNLTTGLGDENADLTQLVLTFGESVATAAKNIIPRIEQTMAGIGSALKLASQELVQNAAGSISDGLPQFVASIGTLMSGLAQALSNSAPILLQSVLSLVNQTTDYVKGNLPQFIASGLSALLSFSEGFRGGVGQMVDAALDLIKTLASGIVEALPEFIATVPTIISNFANAINDNAPKILAAALSIIVTLAKGLVQNIPVIIQNMPKIIGAIWDTLTAVNWVNLGAGLIKGIGNGIKSMTSFVKESIETVKTTIHDGIKALPQTFAEIGRNMIQGMINGIKSMASSLVKNIGSTVTSAVSSVKDLLGIHSPSRVFAGIGENMALGLGKGFQAEMQSVSAGIESAIPTPTVDAVYNAAAGMVNGLAAANAGSSGGSYTVNLVLQNGQKIASWLLPDLRDAARNNPEVAMA